MTLSKVSLRAWLGALLIAATQTVLQAQIGCAGTLDPAFSPPLFNMVFVNPPPFLPAADKGVVVALRIAVLRLDETGALDLNFSPSSVQRSVNDGQINGIQRDSLGRYLIWGYFDKVNSTPRPGIARLLANGDIDPAFVPPDRHWDAAAAALQADGRIIVAVETNLPAVFSPFHVGPAILVRLNPDGSIDQQFNPGAGSDNLVTAIAPQPDGKVLIGGRFKTFDGQPTDGLVRVLPNGALEESFDPEKRVQEVNGLKALADGKFLAYSNGGLMMYDSLNPQATNSLVRYNSDGSLDTSFKPINGSIGDVAIQSDGKYVIPGFGAFRLLPNGDLDSTFHTMFSLALGPGEMILSAPGSIAFGPNEEIYVSGIFSELNGIGRPRLARLLNDQQLCIPLISFESAFQVANESDGVIPVPIIRTGNLTERISFPVYSSEPYAGSRLETNIVFDPGESRKIVQIAVQDNHALENNRTINLYLDHLPPQAAFGVNKSSSLLLVDSSSANLPGSVDPIFNAQVGGYVTQIGVRSDGKIILNGDHLVRLNSDFSIDQTFSDLTASRFAVWGEKLYVANGDGNGTSTLQRLNADGSIDTSFAPATFHSQYANGLRDMVVQPNDKLMVIGVFTNVNGFDRNNIARFNVDGSVDSTLDAGPTPEADRLRKLAILKDGSILVGGQFDQFGGAIRNGLAHLSSSGELLPDFIIPGTANQEVTAIFPETDGGAIVLGRFYLADWYYAIRFNAAGEIDPTFSRTMTRGQVVWGATRQPDGKIVAMLGDINWETKLIRLLPDGTVDPTFYAPQLAYFYALATLPNGDILAIGTFDSFNGWPTPRLVRLRGGQYSGPGIFDIDSTVTAREDAGALKVKIHRLWSTAGSASVRLKTRDMPDVAAAGVNYVPVDPSVAFADGQSEAEVSIPLINTPQFEQSVPFTATLEAESTGTATARNPTVASLFITDDQPFISIVPESPNVFEGADKLNVIVQLLGPTNFTASAEVVTDGGSAVPGVDYQPISQTVQLDDSRRQVAVAIPLIDDNVYEGTKTVRVTLKNPQGAAIFGPASVDVNIVEFADQYRIPNREITAIQNDGSVTVRFIRDTTGRANAPVRFAYKTEGGTAIPGAEYAPQQGELTFAWNDQTPRDITIPLLQNNIIGPPTTFQLKFTLVEGEAVLSNAVATITLQHPPVIIPAGAFDPAFRAFGTSGYVSRLATTPEFIYILGDIPDAQIAGRSFHRYLRDGAYDGTFQPTVHPQQFFPLPNGAVIANIFPSGLLVRLTPDGSIDPSFTPQLPATFEATSVIASDNGKFILAGLINLHALSYPYLRQLLPNGDIDPSFGPVKIGGGGVGIDGMIRQPDGKIIISGAFSSINGVNRLGLARLLPDGNLDSSFVPPAELGISIYKMYLQPDGRILSSGSFFLGPDHYASLLRFNTDGSVDTTYAAPGSNNQQTTLLGLDPQGRAYYLLGRYDEHGLTGERVVVRVLPDDQLDATFHADPNAGGIVPTSQGLFSEGSPFLGQPLLRRLYSDPPSALGAPEILPNGRMALYFQFPANTPYVIEATTDFATWTQVAAGTSASEYVRTESDLLALTTQFYRLRKP